MGNYREREIGTRDLIESMDNPVKCSCIVRVKGGKNKKNPALFRVYLTSIGQPSEAIWLLIQARCTDLNTTWEEHQEVIKIAGQTSRQMRPFGFSSG